MYQSGWYWAKWLYAFMFICGFTMLVIGNIGEKQIYDTLKGIGIIVVVLSLIWGLITIIFLKIQPTGKYEYKVTIDDTVKMTEFNQKYKIINQEGKIYTIKER